MSMTCSVRWIAVAGFGFATLSGCEETDTTSMASTAHLVEPDLDAGGTGEAQIDQKIANVTAALLALGPSVDRNEAARAAEIAVRDPLDWAQEWRVVDPPLLHNMKVEQGFREKGVCQDFANAMNAALHAERFRTLQIHLALANSRGILLEHATVILTARDQPMQEGVILDPWRLGQGKLWFARVADDDRYKWESYSAVQARREQFRAGL